MPTNISNLPFLLPYHIDDGVTAFSTKRYGLGVSKGSYGSLNINPYCGDDPGCVKENIHLLASALHLSPNQIIFPHQIHSDKVSEINQEFLSYSPKVRTSLLEGVDALITDIKGICIGVSTADCVPILLYDPRRRAVGAIHAGWRGTVKRIAAKCVREMKMIYHSDPKDIQAVIGPSISLDAFEVGDEVYRIFEDAQIPMNQIASRISGRWHIDLWECNRDLLIKEGLYPNNIQLCGICTYNNCGDFFSARRLSVHSGRIFSGIILRE